MIDPYIFLFSLTMSTSGLFQAKFITPDGISKARMKWPEWKLVILVPSKSLPFCCWTKFALFGKTQTVLHVCLHPCLPSISLTTSLTIPIAAELIVPQIKPEPPPAHALHPQLGTASPLPLICPINFHSFF